MTKKKEDNTFDIETALKQIEQPDWLVQAFAETIQLNKIKNKNELEKEFKKYMEMK